MAASVAAEQHVSPTRSILAKPGKGVQLPTHSLECLLPPVLLLLCFLPGEPLLPTHCLCTPWGCQMLVHLCLVCPQQPSPHTAAQSWHPIPWSWLSSTPPSPLFCLKHFNVMGQQLRGCPRPLVEALSTFKEEGRDFGLFVVSTLHCGLWKQWDSQT